MADYYEQKRESSIKLTVYGAVFAVFALVGFLGYLMVMGFICVFRGHQF